MTTDTLVEAARKITEHRVRGCQRPIRLKGETVRVNPTTGELVDRYRSADELDGHTYVRCGDRRAWLCESCSREYKGDAWHLLTAGLTGGKGTPETVAEAPALFLTLTAPSFGLVHGIRQKGPCRGRRERPVCPHGRPLWCNTRHTDNDPRLGEPLCPDCYGYRAHVVWQWWAPELWRYTRIRLERNLADAIGVPRSRMRDHFKVAYSKVGEFQARGVVHFHLVLRLDGPDGPGSPAPTDVDTFTATVTDAVRATVLEKPAGPELWRLRWGTQLDVRPITRTAGRDASHGAIHPEMVASYCAKYLTKSTDEFGIRRRIRTPFDVRGLRPHVRAIITTAHRLSQLGGNYKALTNRYATLGYRGHVLTKTRRYSTTFRALRTARRIYRQRPPGLDPDATVRDVPADHEDPDDTGLLVLKSWTYAGTGYLDLPTAHQAIATAARAREHR